MTTGGKLIDGIDTASDLIAGIGIASNTSKCATAWKAAKSLPKWQKVQALGSKASKSSLAKFADLMVDAFKAAPKACTWLPKFC